MAISVHADLLATPILLDLSGLAVVIAPRAAGKASLVAFPPLDRDRAVVLYAGTLANTQALLAALIAAIAAEDALFVVSANV